MRNELDTGYPRRKKQSHAKRNVICALVALVVVLTFFNLDYFTDSGSPFTKSADKKLRFSGDLQERVFTEREIKRLVAFIKRYDEDLERVRVRTTVDEPYKEVTSDTSVLFVVEATLKGGVEMKTPGRRSSRGNLVQSVISKLDKDMRAFREYRDSGRDIRKFVNTM